MYMHDTLLNERKASYSYILEPNTWLYKSLESEKQLLDVLLTFIATVSIAIYFL